MEKKVFRVTLSLLIAGTVMMAQSPSGYTRQGPSPVIRSLILPGSGEYSLGNKKSGSFFFMTELALVTGVLLSSATTKYGLTSLQSYAAEYASISTSSKADQFWVDIGNYDSREAYNAEHLRWREYEALYNNDQSWNWDWKSTAHRKKFRDLRIKNDRLKQTTQFLIGAVVLNHLVSAIDALYLGRVMNARSVSSLPTFDPVTGNYMLSFSIAL